VQADTPRESDSLLAERICDVLHSDHHWNSEREVATTRGLGDNLDFVCTLGKIQGLETLVIEGFDAKNWPAYLEERMCGSTNILTSMR
jgi:hypothetical protein